jgi:hypothetical protein
MSKPLRRRARLGKYVLDKRLGEGAYAQVWRARDTVEGHVVALKLVLPEGIEDMGAERVVREAQVAAALDHPNVLPVLNADWIDDYFALATRLCRHSLDEHTPARRSPRAALRILTDVAAGLAHAHERGVLHRDIKPENILIDDDGTALLSDFGFARWHEEKTLTQCGTLGYMAPEQAYGKATPASDVFSWGLVAYELLAGALPSWPFEWPLVKSERFEKRVPAPYRPVIRTAVAFSPKDRYPDAVALLEGLEEARRSVTEKGELPPAREVLAETFCAHHGASLRMRFACRRCGGSIAEAMTFCPWCTATDHSFREVSGFPLFCPSCERGVRAEWNACGWCGTRLQGNGHKAPRDPRAIRRCAKRGCEGELRRFMRACPLCGTRERRPWRGPGLPDRCERCEGPTNDDYFVVCPWCGA